jgi:hypothetical protein
MKTLRFISLALTLLASCTVETHPDDSMAHAPWGLDAPARYPLKVGPNARYLVDQDGRPFLFWGDAAWSLLAQPSLADALRYLDDRKGKGVNVVLANLIEHAYARAAPADFNGNVPFTGRPFATPNPAYFSDVDQVILAASARNMAVLLAPVYLGFGCGFEGWCVEVQNATTDELRSWGRFLGQRYVGFDNIVWLIGGDNDPTPLAGKLREIVNGIREFDTRHLMTAHNGPDSFAVTPWPNESWLTVNDVYTYSNSLYTLALQAYQRSPVMPFFLIESAYENEHASTPQTLRAQAYWTMLSGGMGQIFGNCPIWHFSSTGAFCTPTDWTTQLGSAGAVSMSILRKLLDSRPWSTLVPDVNHTSVTAGFGDFGSTTYVTAARASDGATMLAYLPSARKITVNMASVSGTAARAWWYDPTSGVATSIGTFATSGSRDFTPTASGDWVFVIDDASRGFGAPGTAAQSVPAAPGAALGILGLALLALGARSRGQKTPGPGVRMPAGSKNALTAFKNG